MRTYSSRYNKRRSGQALLLAVLVMVFAALIGVTFITVVAINIGQTGREEERNKARQAAQAGLAFANLQLTNSVWATRWRPEREVVDGSRFGPPAPGSVTGNFYWTPFDQAQGWADYNGLCNTSIDTCEGNFVKFPDPRSVNPSDNAPNYLVKVEKVVAGAADNQEGDKTGALRITTIGLSPDDPTSFYKVVAYKAGFAQSPLTGAMRSVSNWDFQDGGVPSAKTSSSNSGTSMSIKDLTAKFPSGNFYVTIGNPEVGGTLRHAFVTSATSTTLTFATDPGAWDNNEHVEIAATIGAPLAIDYDRDGTVDPSAEEVRLDVSDSAMTFPGSAWVNGSLILSGNTLLQNLRAPQAAGPNPLGQLRASGLIQVADAGRTKIAGHYADGNSSGQQDLVDSTNGAFPFTGSDARALDIISDGANRINNLPDPTRQNKPFTPPNLMNGGEGFGRYRQLTKYSKGVTGPPQSAAYGYGEGIYINNPQDKERVYDTSINGYREMNQLEFHELIFSNEDNKPYLRLGTPEPRAADNKSLEEQHIRGWVSASEFRPRGALIEFDATLGKIYITKEARKDGRELQEPTTLNIYANEGPVPSQGWYGPDGTLLGGVYGGVYRQEFDWPENGVIFAEGNVRIRGEMPGATKSLTVVSMNNIYIEGSLNAGTHKILLLAKKNVLVNPTRVLGSIDDQTRLAEVPGVDATSIIVSDASAFKSGDWVEIKLGDGSFVRRQISNTTSDTITFPTTTPLPANTYEIGQIVQVVQDPLFVDATPEERPFSQHAIRIEKFEDVVQRRLHLAPGTTQIRLALRHNAERKEALTVGTQPPGGLPNAPTLNSAEMANRLVSTTGQSIIQAAEKSLVVEYDESPSDPDDNDDTFPNPTLPATQADAVAIRLTDLASDMNTEHPLTQWRYDVSIQNNYDSGPNLPLFYFLASVSNRHDWLTQPGVALPVRKDIAGGNYIIPMATSVQTFLNGVPMALGLFDPTNATNIVKQFGFNPTYIGTDDLEDVLTSDQGFYQSISGNPTTSAYSDLLTHDNTNYTLDSRIMQVTGAANGIYDLALRLNNSEVVPGTTVENYFNASSTSSDIPYYRLSRMKLENADLFGADGTPNILVPGYSFNIQAFVYAQEGSWLVIPGDLFDSKVKAGYVDLNDNGAQDSDLSATPPQQESLDLNRDGVVTPDEQIAPLRFARYNYQINFKGAIMENQAAPVNEPGGTALVKGAVSEWTDKWATISQDFSAATVPTYGSIKYEFDPTAITAAFVPANALNADEGFHPPISSELIYQTG